ncbi:MAG: hypothetical protein OEX01_08705 [Candidatus Bathyarchaeota archaeon]|nr:hypothetical protein [Candidatus Bathyarchaeota archaeon]
MPYKNKEKQKKYMRDYQRERRAAIKDLQRRVNELEKLIFGKPKPKRRRKKK